MNKAKILEMIEEYGELTASAAVARREIDFIDNYVKETRQRAEDDSAKAIALMGAIAAELEK